MNTRDIHDQPQDLYGIEMSAEMVSKITDKILPEIREWQSRPLNQYNPRNISTCAVGLSVSAAAGRGLALGVGTVAENR